MTTNAGDKERDSSGKFTKGNTMAFKPGQSGNPAGRKPNDLCITSLVRKLLESDAGKGKTHAELVALALVSLAKDKAEKGNMPAIRELLDRIEGKVPTPVNIGGLGGGPVEILIRYDDEPKEVKDE